MPTNIIRSIEKELEFSKIDCNVDDFLQIWIFLRKNTLYRRTQFMAHTTLYTVVNGGSQPEGSVSINLQKSSSYTSTRLFGMA